MFFFHFSLITFKLAINIVLLGVSCNLIDEHRRNLEDKVCKTLGGQSTSLPTSRRNSVSELTILDDEKLLEIKEKIAEQTSNKQTKTSINAGTRSTPHSPSTSPRNSLEDITEQAILQNTLESSIIFSDSTVSLVSMNDGQNLRLPQDDIQKENVLKLKHKTTSPRTKLFALSSLKRRISLQERPNNMNICYSSKTPTDEIQLDREISNKNKTS